MGYKKRYNQYNQVIGAVYAIVCTENNKKYIGKTLFLTRREKDHFKMLQNNIHTNKLLQQDYNLYGQSSFQFTILEDYILEEDLLMQETAWMNYFGGIESDSIYNMTDCTTSNNYVRQKISKSNSNKKRNEQICEKFSIVKNNLMKSEKGDNIKNQISKSLTNYYNTEKGKQQKSNQSELMKHRHSEGCYDNIDKTLSIEARQKISIANKGKIPYNKGKKGLYHPTEDTKNKQREKSTKYTQEFIDILTKDYKLLGSYRAVADKYNMNKECVSRLIRFRTTKFPKSKV